ncbi:xanthine dehydrogenase family protein subunit M [Solihabitans fulvus]|uniref:Xanthine dehydrogenase family protein subunit M n=1 Tax=Solihabitans fulvus TaxID=1892852 RepID=A0A5B2WE05_9PSEU|nr:xanthine dehydrogenase family protein subunit M [Solihabitans fulvus]KAA2248872.1 xanthine dehydrogenase family protein subunit M [Solihabitans fulvus]
MIPVAFDYLAPSTVDEAVRALVDAGEDAKVLAGGQSLLPVLRMRLAAPSMVVDLSRVGELRGVREEGDELVIGAMTSHHDVLRDQLVRTHALLLAEATTTVADPQVRHRGTLGGALAHADPAGDLPAPVLALGGDVVLAGPTGRRTVPVERFFVDYFTTELAQDELLVEIRLPKRTGWGARYEKFSRVAQAWSTVAVAATVLVRDGRFVEAKVALTNMGAVPVRAYAVEEALVGGSADADAIHAAARHAAEGTNPTSDASADAEYRQHLARVLTARALTAAAAV